MVYVVLTVKYDSVKGQVRNVEVLLVFSGSCIPINPKLSHIFPPEFLVVFNRSISV
jgi:hypothetical protein